MNYEIIVVGGGHAGCEAALATARKGHKTLLVTSSIDNIATLPCNPSIGGSAKGIVVREIDALGGEMGKVADKSHFQIKMLNRNKGPAVRSLRSQVDCLVYPKEMLKTLIKQKNLAFKESMVEDLIIKKNVVAGVVLEDLTLIKSKIVILTTGTYLKSNILIGDSKFAGGPAEQKPSMFLSDNLRKLGFEISRLKTGTPARIKKDSIDFNQIKIEKGDNELLTFSFDLKPKYKIDEQEPCYLIYTNNKTHKIILDNLDKSSMYGGIKDILGTGPRYCPSIEDKIVRFKGKERHQLFLEPESRFSDNIYLQGFSTSMPPKIQKKMIRSLKGLEKAVIKRYGYAIEYDSINPLNLKSSLETKLIKNLFTAGQLNGTSGYEEAAAQGLIAGINAALKLEKKKPLILKRNEAYIGVLIDDLITKGTYEPYRLLTSRAEFRLLLRHDNADLRLRKIGYKIGLVDQKKYNKIIKKVKEIAELEKKLRKTIIIKEKINTNAYNYLKQPAINFKDISSSLNKKYSKEVIEQVIINTKYEGYIKKMIVEVERMLKNENKKIPVDTNYDNIHNLANEAKQKLKEIRPISIGQAMRISGVNPVDISMLLIYLKRISKNEGK